MDLFFPVAATVLFVYFVWRRRRAKKRKKVVELQPLDPMEELSGNEAGDELDIVLLSKPLKTRDDFYSKEA
jgi:hypothetical protein